MTTRTTPIVALMLLAASAGASHAAAATYQCSSGTKLTATFSPPTVAPGRVVLRFTSRGNVILPQVMSADGGRYANEQMEFWIKGRSATLTRDGRSETCQTQ